MMIHAESARLVYEPLAISHAAELGDSLTDPRVYAYLAGSQPTSTADLANQFARMIAGPPDSRQNEIWLNFAVRLRSENVIGRIQATIHDGLAEVAYLFGPSYWGCGYATEALHWLHGHIRETQRAASCWATVLSENARSIRLLERVGYTLALEGWPQLLGYDPGDLVYQGPLLLK